MRAKSLAVAILTLITNPLYGEVAVKPTAEQAAAQLLPFKKSLKKTLMSSMQQGPIEAIGACQLQAPLLAEKASGDGVRVGRSSDRLRNPNNAPEGWLQPLLSAYLEGNVQGAQLIDLPDGHWAYMESIKVQGLCLSCHGDSLAPAVSAKLAESYPDDRATGYQAGDMRGLFWMTSLPE